EDSQDYELGDDCEVLEGGDGSLRPSLRVRSTAGLCCAFYVHSEVPQLRPLPGRGSDNGQITRGDVQLSACTIAVSPAVRQRQRVRVRRPVPRAYLPEHCLHRSKLEVA